MVYIKNIYWFNYDCMNDVIYGLVSIVIIMFI